MSAGPRIACVAGLDEAGRGALAGPVYAAAVILDERDPFEGLRDSKALSAKARERLAQTIVTRAEAWAVASASVAEIESINILRASLLAMQRAWEALSRRSDSALVDGLHLPKLGCAAQAVVDGDALHPCIMAASILAKVNRDAEMCRLDAEYPGYGFAAHKGYGTRVHLDALNRLGATPVHRRTFAPVAQLSLRLA
ncbi:ribonuclease HII [Algiphilus sp. W345]|uniref:Ribonuclease HII n=1 Tax=Banduia mediterranea TaxID=3075609 RepID=A0ABU2WHA5_9GAMM|nr:ribonuclease HII [Algiphilus sp. W345]MDT0497252.1 ribonuclease HII [Algiphilus sp. W345]